MVSAGKKEGHYHEKGVYGLFHLQLHAIALDFARTVLKLPLDNPEGRNCWLNPPELAAIWVVSSGSVPCLPIK